MSTELQVAEVEAQAGSKLEQGEPSALTVEQRGQLNREIYGEPDTNSTGKEGSEYMSKKDGGPFTLDENGKIETFGNKSGTIENFQEQLKEMLKQENGKHVLEIDGKKFPYSRTDEGIILHTPDYKDGLRIDNNGNVLEVLDNLKDKPKIKLNPDQIWGP
ncbi:MAG: hypothetical protein IPG59_04920 [Candidatus Melainabacteria bacterium]|nr:MAG: hypothetical protein IPG59_04920 [Candidatus Melainabacteria bacterium]